MYVSFLNLQMFLKKNSKKYFDYASDDFSLKAK